MKTEYSLIKDFDYTDVIINDNYFNNITKKDVDFLNTFNPDKLLFNFRLTAGFNTDEIKSVLIQDGKILELVDIH